MKRFISALELVSRLTDVVLVDCDLRAAYERFHLPGAIHAPCRYWKGDGNDEDLLAIDNLDLFQTLVAEWGISEENSVVAYDSSGGLNAARLAWTFERFGCHSVSVLDGGMQSWYASGGPLTQEEPSPRLSTFDFQASKEHNRVMLEELLTCQDDLWDNRSIEEWENGRIPRAVHLEWRDLLDDHNCLLPVAELESAVQGLGLSPERPVIVYCEGGIRAAHSYWVLKHLGFEEVRVYDGSWAEYGKLPNLGLGNSPENGTP